MRELDQQVAEKVFGRERLTARVDPINRDGEPQYHWGYPVGHDFAPPYSTDIAAAIEIIFKLADEGIFVQIDFAQTWNVSFWKDGNCIGGDSQDALPEAICRAALASVGAADAQQEK